MSVFIYIYSHVYLFCCSSLLYNFMFPSGIVFLVPEELSLVLFLFFFSAGLLVINSLLFA